MELAEATREAIEPAGFRMLTWRDDAEAGKPWISQLRASGPPPWPNLGVVMGPDFAQLSGDPDEISWRPARHPDRGVRGRAD
jgi:sarcosine/dimethylglycine N-methyltransferase